MKPQKRKNVFAGILMALCLLFPFMASVKQAKAEGASLYLSPGSISIKTGKTFSVTVYVKSDGQAMNAASGSLSFMPDKLEAVSISKTGSIFSLWASEPSFNNASGRLEFEGIVFNPGYTGKAGKVLSVTFKAKAEGEAFIGFAAGSVLANDGQGTNITGGLSGAKISIQTGQAAIAEPVQTSQAKEEVVFSAPQITSSTHPDQGRWYNDNNPEFSWQIPSGTTAASFTADQNPGTVPQGVFAVQKSYAYKNVKDGVWYFHLRLKNRQGWSETAHFQFKIDTQKPQGLSVTAEDESRGRFYLEANDDVSGIDHYEMQIDEVRADNWLDPDTHEYALAKLETGTHELVVRAVDKAGNFAVSSVQFSVPSVVASEHASGRNYQAFKMVFWAIMVLALVILLAAIRVKKFYPAGSGAGTLGGLWQAVRDVDKDLSKYEKILNEAKSHRKLTEEENKILSQMDKDIKELEEAEGEKK